MLYTSELVSALYLALFALIGVAIVLVTLMISRLVAPRHLTPGKLAVYECGEAPIGGTEVQFNVNYYLFAIMFVIFDVEVAFFFPWAAAFGALGWYGVVGVLLFLLILLEGLIYAWQRGVLKWVY